MKNVILDIRISILIESWIYILDFHCDGRNSQTLHSIKMKLKDTKDWDYTTRIMGIKNYSFHTLKPTVLDLKGFLFYSTKLRTIDFRFKVLQFFLNLILNWKIHFYDDFNNFTCICLMVTDFCKSVSAFLLFHFIIQ